MTTPADNCSSSRNEWRAGGPGSAVASRLLSAGGARPVPPPHNTFLDLVYDDCTGRLGVVGSEKSFAPACAAGSHGRFLLPVRSLRRSLCRPWPAGSRRNGSAVAAGSGGEEAGSAALGGTRDYELSLEHLCWGGFEETILSEVVLTEGVEAARGLRFAPRVWRAVLGRLLALGWVTPEQVTPAIMESRPLLRAVARTQSRPTLPRSVPTPEDRDLQLRRASSPRPRWLWGLCVTGLAAAMLLPILHLTAHFAASESLPPRWVYLTCLALTVYLGLTHAWAPPFAIARLVLFGMVLYAIVGLAAVPVPWLDQLLPASVESPAPGATVVWFLALIWFGPLTVLLMVIHAAFTWRGSYVLYPSPAERRGLRFRAWRGLAAGVREWWRQRWWRFGWWRHRTAGGRESKSPPRQAR